jgi:hypothetical protein
LLAVDRGGGVGRTQDTVDLLRDAVGWIGCKDDSEQRDGGNQLNSFHATILCLGAV